MRADLLWRRGVWLTIQAWAQVVRIDLSVLLAIIADVVLEIHNVCWRIETILMVMEPHVCVGTNSIATNIIFTWARRPFLAWLATRLLQVVDIEMGRAALVIPFSTVHCSHRVLTFSGHILVSSLMGSLVLHISLFVDIGALNVLPSASVTQLRFSLVKSTSTQISLHFLYMCSRYTL